MKVRFKDKQFYREKSRSQKGCQRVSDVSFTKAFAAIIMNKLICKIKKRGVTALKELSPILRDKLLSEPQSQKTSIRVTSKKRVS